MGVLEVDAVVGALAVVVVGEGDVLLVLSEVGLDADVNEGGSVGNLMLLLLLLSLFRL